MPRKYNKDDVLVTLDTFSKVAGKTKESTDYLEYEIREGISTPLVIVIRASESYQGATFTATSKVDGRSYSDTLDGDFLYLKVKSPGEYTVSNSHDENTMTALVGDPLQEEVYFTDFYGTIDVSVDELLIGETIEATNGETKVEKLAETNITTLSVYKSGEWTVGIKGTEAVEKKQVTLSDMGESKSCRLEVTESTPTITVTLSEELKGESVTLKKSEYTRTKTAKENTVKFFVPEQGEWVVHLTASEAIREQVNVNDNKNFDVTLDLSDLSTPILIVTTKEENRGKILKVSRADTTIEKPLDPQGTIFFIPVQGEYTLSCDDLPEKTKRLLLNENKIYKVMFGATIFGIRVKQDESDPIGRIEPLEDLVGLTPITADRDQKTVDYGDMEDTFLFKAMNHVVLLSIDGEEEIELNPNDYSQKLEGGAAPDATTTSNYNTFAKWEKVYTYQYTSDGYEYYYISEDKVNDNYSAIGFTREDDSEADYSYFSTYIGSYDNQNRLRSISGSRMRNRTAFTDFASAARKNGDGYTLEQVQQINFIQVAFLILFQNFDTQKAIAQGRPINGGWDSNTTGLTTGFANTKGPIGIADNSAAIKFMHIEDLWTPASYTWEEGLVVTKENKLYVRMKPPYITTINADVSTYTYVEGAALDNGWISASVSDNKYGRIPSKLEGSEYTYECDYNSYTSSLFSTYDMLLFNTIGSSGLFANVPQVPITTGDDRLLGRLCYLPPAK